MKKMIGYTLLMLIWISQAFAIDVILKPQEVTLRPGEGCKFEWALFNEHLPFPTPDNLVTWSVIPETLGKITEDGYFMAGREAGTGFVKATLALGGEALAATAAVTVGQPTTEPITIIVKPDTAIIEPGGQQAFTVYVKGPDGVALQTQSIRWLVTPSYLGTISANGLFQAGDQIGEGKIMAAVEYKDRLYKGYAYLVVSPAAESALLGVVLDESGAALSGATISATRLGWSSFTRRAKSDSKGAYALGKLIPGYYVVKAEAEAYLPEYYKNADRLISAQPVKLAAKDTVRAVDFSLSKGGGISGVVTTADATPLAGAHVFATMVLNPLSQFHTLTDEQGAYKVAGLLSGTYVVSAQKNGYVTEIYKEVKRLDQATPVKVESPAITSQIDFTLDKTNAITGIITSDKDGAPIAGALVYARPAANSREIDWNNRGGAKTDEKGIYTIEVAAGNYLLWAEAKGFAGEYYKDVTERNQATPVVVAENEHVQVDMALTLLGGISGKVTDALTGKPIPEAKVRLFAERRIISRYNDTRTAADGTYTFTGLAEGGYIVQADAGGYLSEYWQEADSIKNAATVTVKNGNAVLDINFTLSHGTTIQGLVLTFDKTPLADAVVTLLSENGWLKQVVKSSSDGTWSVSGLRPGKYYAMAIAPGYSPQWYDQVTSKREATAIEVTETEIKQGIDFSLSKIVRQGATISGLVKDDSTDLALENVMVIAMPVRQLQRPRHAVTDKEGKYEITDIAAGTYVVTAAAKGYIAEYYENTRSWKKAKTLQLTATDKLTGINFELAPQLIGGYMIAGRVMEKSGDVSPYALVSVTVDDAVVAAALCEEDGQYALTELPADEYQLVASAPGYVDTVSPSSTPIAIGHGKNTYDASITMIAESTTDVANPLTALPLEYSLEQNYPNPFNPTTEIRFHLAEQAHVQIQIYNLLGKVVRTLYDAEVNAGSHRVTWDGADDSGRRLASGIYLYRMHSSSGRQTFTQTRRMILMK